MPRKEKCKYICLGQLGMLVQVLSNTVALVASIVIASGAVGVGVKYWNSECKYDLSLWMVVMGAGQGAIAILVALKLVQICVGACFILPLHGISDDSSAIEGGAAISSCISAVLYFPLGVLHCFVLVWLIIGSIWVFGTDSSVHHCPEVLYNFTIGVVVAIYAYTLFFVLCLCLCAPGATCVTAVAELQAKAVMSGYYSSSRYAPIQSSGPSTGGGWPTSSSMYHDGD